MNHSIAEANYTELRRACLAAFSSQGWKTIGSDCQQMEMKLLLAWSSVFLIQLYNTHFSVGSVLEVSQEGLMRRGNFFFGANNINGWEEYMFLDAQAVL